MSHDANALFGWSLILAGFVSGAALGLGFHRDEFLGGYGSFRRRILRLGHIACVALGMLNVLFSVAAAAPLGAVGGTAAGSGSLAIAGRLLIAGGLAMPTVCFLTAWRAGFRRLFFIPVVCLVSAAVLVLVALCTAGASGSAGAAGS